MANLRSRKHREEKPFALMVASLDAARLLADLTAEDEELLASRERPIVLVPRRSAGPSHRRWLPGAGSWGSCFRTPRSIISCSGIWDFPS